MPPYCLIMSESDRWGCCWCSSNASFEIAHLEESKESRSCSSRIIVIIRYKQVLKQHYNIVILLYYDYGATVHHPLALQQPLPQNTPRMAVSPHTSVLQTKVGYQKKRKTMVFPPVCHTVVKLHHGDHQDETGIFPTHSGIFSNKKTGHN
jgi:hypothetical protein